MQVYNPQIAEAIKTLREAQLDASAGLPQELFWLVSSLIPVVNVDLLIVNKFKQVLLTWRDDEFYNQCWHIPGGCVRFGETMIQTVHKTAREELGVDVHVNEIPLTVRDAINPPFNNRQYVNERRHNVSVLFCCHLPDGFEIHNETMKENTPGYKKWFDQIPENFVAIQHIYDDILKPWIKDL